ncbi:unnamed protein product [Echinostoma caproni]|uniref:Peptidase_M13_N domain-containing protein n=1 Tax=Echinostoma caproni TaxID=27848 RepID=A0A183A800_9TREM|nr:unnamed protein product [Echinostoma caproni]
MREYSKLLGVPEDKLASLDAVYQFEHSLALLNKPRADLDPEIEYEVTTVNELDKYCPVLQWKRLINELFKPLKFTVSDDQPVALTDKTQLQARCDLYATYMKTTNGIQILHNQAVWTFIWNTVKQMPEVVQVTLKEFNKLSRGKLFVNLGYVYLLSA